MRARRRRRRHRTRQRAALLAPRQQTNSQDHRLALHTTLAYNATRAGVAARLPDPAVQTSIAGDLTRLDAADRLLTILARALVTTAKAPEAQPCSRLRAIPGIGQLVALVLRDAIHERRRCPRVQDCGASGRLVTCATAAAGQRSGPSGQTLGQTSRTGACAEAAGRLWRNHPAGRQDLAHLERIPGQGNALTSLAHPVARAVYDRRKRDTACALATCRRESWSRAGAPAASRAAAGSAGRCGERSRGVRERPGAHRPCRPAPCALLGRARGLLHWCDSRAGQTGAAPCIFIPS